MAIYPWEVFSNFAITAVDLGKLSQMCTSCLRLAHVTTIYLVSNHG
jgi:hypothetical protein